MKQGDNTTKATWEFTGGSEVPPEEPKSQKQAMPPVPPQEDVSWTASEYVHHHKGASWFLLLFLVVAVLAAAIYLVTGDVVSTVVIAAFGLSFALFAAREPDVLEYAVDRTGIHIGTKLYAYNLFRSFSVLQEDGLRSILLMPQKRFSLPITLYYDPNDEEEIVNVVGSHLPHEDRNVPTVDRLMSKIHF